MRKAVAIYHAPVGDSKVCEMGGVTFFDGQPIDLNSEDNPHLISKLPGNPHFEVEMGEEVESRRRPGRPSNAEKAAEALKADQTKQALEPKEPTKAPEVT